MACVYALTSSKSPDAIRYVGITKNDSPDIRIKRHFVNAARGIKYPVYDWIRKHLAAGFQISATLVATGVSWGEACVIEKDQIAQRRKANDRLLNMTDGGEGVVGLKPSDATREKLRVASTGRICTDETRAKIGAANLGTKHSSAAIEKTRVANTGRKHTAEHCANISAAQKGKTVSDETRARISATMTGRTYSPERRAAAAEGQRGRVPWNKGKRQPGA